MARISFEEFSSGLPVRRQSEIDDEQQQQTAAEQAPPSFGEERKQDSSEMGTALLETAGEAKAEISRIRETVASGEVSPLKGTYQTLGTGLLKGGEAIAEAGIGMAKQILPQAVETRIKETLGEDLGEIFSRESLDNYTEKISQEDGGLLLDRDGALSRKQGETMKEVLNLYDTDEQFKRDVDASFGIGNTVLSLLTGGGYKSGKPETSGNIPVKGQAYNPTQTVPIIDRTAQQASEAVVSSANPVKSGGAVADTISGVKTQVSDFAERTVKSAQDTAEQSRRLNEMPPAQSTLIRKGADERVVNVIKEATPEEVSVYRELIEQAKRKEVDPTPNTAQPKQIAGREFLKPVKHIIDTRKNAGAKLGEIRKSLSDTKNVNTNPAFRNFHQLLKEKYQLQFDKDGVIVQGKGVLGNKDIVEVQKLYDELRSKTITSQKDIDEFLRRSLEDFDITQQREKAFSSKVSEVAEASRHEMRQLMSDDYNKWSTEYAKLSKPIEDTAKLLGYKGDMNAISAKDLKAGEVALRILGNAADRPQSVIDAVFKTANEYGYTSKIDLNRLIYVTDQLEDLYDITPSRGFSGSATRGIDQSAAGTLGDVATLNVGGLFKQVTGSQATRQEVKEAFEAYVNSLGKDKTPSVSVTPKVKALSQEGDLLLKDLEVRQAESLKGSIPDYLKDNKQAGYVAGGVKELNITKEIKDIEALIKKFENDGIPTSNLTLKRLIAKRNELIKTESSL